MRLFGNFGSIRVGAFAIVNPLANLYWNRQQNIRLKAAHGTVTKYVKLNNEDLSAFYIRNKNNKGSVVINISQGNAKKDIDISGEFYEMVDMSGFNTDEIIEIVIHFKSATNIKSAIGWRK